MNTVYDVFGSEAETSYRRQQVRQQFQAANGRRYHQPRRRRWRERRDSRGL